MKIHQKCFSIATRSSGIITWFDSKNVRWVHNWKNRYTAYESSITILRALESSSVWPSVTAESPAYLSNIGSMRQNVPSSRRSEFTFACLWWIKEKIKKYESLWLLRVGYLHIVMRILLFRIFAHFWGWQGRHRKVRFRGLKEGLKELNPRVSTWATVLCFGLELKLL